MTTIASPHPDVPLPRGAVPSNDPEEWAMWDNQFRVIYGEERSIPGTKAVVYVSAVQCADGSIEARDEGANQPGPTVSVQAHWDDFLTPDQARDLALQVALAAELAESWTRHVAGADELDWRAER